MISHDNSNQSDWLIDTEIAIAKHLPSGVVFRYLPVPYNPEQIRTYVIIAHGEYANIYNLTAQGYVKQIGELGKAFYQAALDGKQYD